MNFKIFLKLSKIQYHYNSLHSSDEHQAFFAETVTTAAKRMPEHAWWSTFRGSIPELQNVADFAPLKLRPYGAIQIH